MKYEARSQILYHVIPPGRFCQPQHTGLATGLVRREHLCNVSKLNVAFQIDPRNGSSQIKMLFPCKREAYPYLFLYGSFWNRSLVNRALIEFFSVYVFRIRLICVKNAVYVVLATLQQFNFCCLLRFIIISSVHGAFLVSINVHVQDIGTQKLLQRKS